MTFPLSAAYWASVRPRVGKDNSASLSETTISLHWQGIHIVDPLSSGEELNRTEGTPINVHFRVNEGKLFFSLNHNEKNINGEVRPDRSAKYGDESVALSILVKPVDLGLLVRCTTDTENPLVFSFLIRDLVDLNTLQGAQIGDPLQISSPISTEPVNESLKKIFKQENDVNLRVELFAQTDNFGLNLGELGGIVTADESYPNGYPKELVGECDNAQQVTDIGVQTLYSFKPKLNTVLKGNGNTLFAQSNDVNSMYNTGLSDCEFYLNIIAYSTYRYMLAGLSSNGNFSIKWLYANNYEKFLRNLRNSEFSAAVVIFTEPQENFDFTNFNRYFINCDHK